MNDASTSTTKNKNDAEEERECRPTFSYSINLAAFKTIESICIDMISLFHRANLATPKPPEKTDAMPQ